MRNPEHVQISQANDAQKKYREGVVAWLRANQSKVVPPFEYPIKIVCALAWSNYLIDHKQPTLDIFESEDALQDYFDKFVKESGARAWADEINLVAIAMANNVHLRIFQELSLGGLNTPQEYNVKGKKTYDIIYNGTNHYDALIRTSTIAIVESDSEDQEQHDSGEHYDSVDEQAQQETEHDFTRSRYREF